jgi:hypothetical protein
MGGELNRGKDVRLARQSRRLSKDYERKVQTSEALIEVAMIRLMLRRLASSQLGSSA